MSEMWQEMNQEMMMLNIHYYIEHSSAYSQETMILYLDSLNFCSQYPILLMMISMMVKKKKVKMMMMTKVMMNQVYPYKNIIEMIHRGYSQQEG